MPAPASPADIDSGLIAAVRKGDSRAMGLLLSRHQDQVFSHCLRVLRHRQTAEDVAQDAMVKVIQGLDSYDGRSKFSTWMYTIVHNACLSKLRSEKYRRHARLDTGAAPGEEDSPGLGAGLAQGREPDAMSRVELGEAHRRLLDALDRLEDDYRAILLLRDSRGLDYEQIAEILAVPVGTVKSRLFRAREALRREIENQSSDPSAF